MAGPPRPDREPPQPLTIPRITTNTAARSPSDNRSHNARTSSTPSTPPRQPLPCAQLPPWQSLARSVERIANPSFVGSNPTAPFASSGGGSPDKPAVSAATPRFSCAPIGALAGPRRHRRWQPEVGFRRAPSRGTRLARLRDFLGVGNRAEIPAMPFLDCQEQPDGR